MPYSILKRKCTDSDGNGGSYVLVKKDSGEEVSCHKSRKDAELARRARHASEGSIVKAEDIADFTAPLSKEESNYKKLEDTSEMCGTCVHYVYTEPLFPYGLCHLVKGYIKYDHVCEYFANKLLNIEEDTEMHDVLAKINIPNSLANISEQNIKEFDKYYKIIFANQKLEKLNKQVFAIKFNGIDLKIMIGTNEEDKMIPLIAVADKTLSKDDLLFRLKSDINVR